MKPLKSFKKIAEKLGYKLVDHRLELYGIPDKEKNKIANMNLKKKNSKSSSLCFQK